MCSGRDYIENDNEVNDSLNGTEEEQTGGDQVPNMSEEIDREHEELLAAGYTPLEDMDLDMTDLQFGVTSFDDDPNDIDRRISSVDGNSFSFPPFPKTDELEDGGEIMNTFRLDGNQAGNEDDKDANWNSSAIRNETFQLNRNTNSDSVCESGILKVEKELENLNFKFSDGESKGWVSFDNAPSAGSFGSSILEISDGTIDFRSIADQAIMSLEKDYTNTKKNSKHLPPEMGSNQSYTVNDNETENSFRSMQMSNNSDRDIESLSYSKVPASPKNILKNTISHTDPKSNDAIKAEAGFSSTSIDTDAVKRAMQKIHLKSQKAFDSWSQDQNEKRKETQSKNSQKKKPINSKIVFSTPSELPPLSSLISSSLQHVQISSQPKSMDSDISIKKEILLHDIIPSTPIRAFQRSTSKAIKSTANLSRSATIAESLVRLFNHPDRNAYFDNMDHITTLTIHVVGADHIECSSKETIESTFRPLIRWICSATNNSNSVKSHTVLQLKRYYTIDIILLGPNVPTYASKQWTESQPLDIFPHSPIEMGEFYSTSLKKASVICKRCVYHDYLKSLVINDTNGKELNSSLKSLGLVIAFNAGIYGYNEWIPTLDYMMKCQNKRIPFVATAYTVEEAEDDAELIQTTLALTSTNDEEDDNAYSEINEKNNTSSILRYGECLWEVEENPFGSKVERETVTALEGRKYYENRAWQSWLFGKDINCTEVK